MTNPQKPNLQRALAAQAANITQRAMLDVLTTKVIRVKQILTDSELRSLNADEAASPEALEAAINEALRVLGMDRHETREMRPTFELDDSRIQEILDRAINEMVAVLLKTE